MGEEKKEQTFVGFKVCPTAKTANIISQREFYAKVPNFFTSSKFGIS